MGKITFLIIILLFLFSTNTTNAQPALDVKTELRQLELTGTEGVSNQQSSPQPQINKQPTTQQQTAKNQQVTPSPIGVNPSLSEIQNFQNRLSNLEGQANKYREDPKVNNWLIWWWQIGFWVGILWIFPWVFVGWQWTHFKFWGFGWPWPWWFWIPLVWFIPWLWIGWMWWLDWWVWWIWIWWFFPWVFWVFWWIILFKEAMIGVWHRKGPSNKETG